VDELATKEESWHEAYHAPHSPSLTLSAPAWRDPEEPLARDCER